MELLDLSLVNGDLQIGQDGDLLVARGADCLVQDVAWRLATTPGDWMLEPQCGANLEALIGKSNTPDTWAALERQVSDSLLNDGYFQGILETVDAVPLSRTALLALITLNWADETFTTIFNFSLDEGLHES